MMRNYYIGTLAIMMDNIKFYEKNPPSKQDKWKEDHYREKYTEWLKKAKEEYNVTDEEINEEYKRISAWRNELFLYVF